MFFAPKSSAVSFCTLCKIQRKKGPLSGKYVNLISLKGIEEMSLQECFYFFWLIFISFISFFFACSFNNTDDRLRGETKRRTVSHLVARWGRAPHSRPIRLSLCPALGLALSLYRAPSLALSRDPSLVLALAPALGLSPGRARAPSLGRVRGLSRVQTTCSASCLCAKTQLQRKDKTKARIEQRTEGEKGLAVVSGGRGLPGEMGEVV